MTKLNNDVVRPSVLLLLLSLLLSLAPAAGAHGGGTPQLVNEPAGPYWLSVWTSPDPALVDEPLHLTIGVAEPGTAGEAGAPVLGAAVDLTLSPPPGTGSPVTAAATGAANRLLYDVDVTLPEPGLWTVEIGVEGPEGSSRASFDLEVAEASGPNWLLWGGGVVVVIAAIFILAGRRR
jgi:hypothetical protein